MKNYSLVFLLLISTVALNQIEIQEILPGVNQPPFLNELVQATNASIVSEDIDNDGDSDILIQGAVAIPGSSVVKSRIYLNEGDGNFTEDLDEVITGMKMGDADFGDVDNDGDLDFVTNGLDPYGDPRTELYLNDGTGHFTLVIGTGFTGVYDSAIRLFDADGDLDLDIISSGYIGSGSAVTQIYLNDGSGVFLLDLSNSLPPMTTADLETGDVDLDGDIDLFLCGWSICDVYLNDGLGVFTLDVNLDVPLATVRSSEMVDFDFDGDLDFLALGIFGPNQLVLRYLNDGTGLFIADSVSDFNLSNYILDESKSFDYNLDGYMDLVLTGLDNSSNPLTETYLRHPSQDSLYLFSSSIIQSFISSDMELVDIDSDLVPELIMCGLDNLGTCTRIFTTSGSGIYKKVPESIFGEGYYESAMDFADIDNDGDLDMFICGMKNEVQSSELYLNDGNGNYTELATTITPIWYGDSKFGDIDGDTDQDLLISGYASAGPFTKLYLNNGTGLFSPSSEALIHLKYSSVSLADIDNDTDLDIMLTGTDGSSSTTRHYINNGAGNFTLAPFNILINNMSGGDAEFLDADMDGDQDFIISGGTSGGLVTKIYLNDGSGYFNPSANSMTGLTTGSLAVADLDGDLDPDLIVTGENNVGTPASYVYINNGSGIFTSTANTLIQVDNSSIDATDFDLDGDVDLLLSGLEFGFLKYATKFYSNDGIGNFTAVPLPIEAVGYSSNKFVDIDSDGDDDIVSSGYGGCGPELRSYLNFSCIYSTNVNANICAGDYYVFPGNDTLFNILNDTVVSILIPVISDCDTVHNTTILVSEIDTVLTQNYNFLESQENAADTYLWYNCDSSNYAAIASSNLLFEASLPGNYALIINKGACVDTSICFTITNQDFYDNPAYVSLFAEVFPIWPTSSLSACDATVAAFAIGGIPPFSYNWFSQPSNTDTMLLENACYGIYTIKIFDALGDSVLVDYFVTDYANYDSLNISGLLIADTAYVSASNCLIDYSLDLDTVYVNSMQLLFSDLNTDTYEIEIVYSQLSFTYSVVDTITISNLGSAVLIFNLFCPTKSDGLIKTFITHLAPFFVGSEPEHASVAATIIYPNPFSDNVFIFDQELYPNNTIYLYDLSGKLVYSCNVIIAGSATLNLSHLASGPYFVEYFVNGKTKTSKIVRN